VIGTYFFAKTIHKQLIKYIAHYLPFIDNATTYNNHTKLKIYLGNPNGKTNILLASSRLFIIQWWENYRFSGSSLCSLVTSGQLLLTIHNQRTPLSVWVKHDIGD
jgi:hypothetical protein